MKFGILVFPGTWSDRDCGYALESLGQEIEYVWHAETDIDRFDALVVPGGFSYGDYLRAGAIARFAPVMESVSQFAEDGRPVIGICNGFQILCEAGLLPGALIRNDHMEFRCSWTDLRVENDQTIFSHMAKSGDLLRVPISHGEGSYQADEDTIDELERNGRVGFREPRPAGVAAPRPRLGRSAHARGLAAVARRVRRRAPPLAAQASCTLSIAGPASRWASCTIATAALGPSTLV